MAGRPRPNGTHSIDKDDIRLMHAYSPRRIVFREIIAIKDWRIKMYTICKEADFTAESTYKAVIEQLAEWLERSNSFDSGHEHLGFCLVHQATEGVIVVLNWWVGKNMLNTHIYLAEDSTPTRFKQIDGDGLGPCVWELEVIDTERRAWLQHFLKPYPDVDLNSYLDSTVSMSL